MGGRIWSIGHSTHTATAFVALLEAHGITCLHDVRRHPGSRRYPHFGVEPLAALLAEASIGYVHAPALGGRRAPRAGSPNGAWRNAHFRGYADHMASREFLAALQRLECAAARQRIVLMCAEAVPWRCHRNLLADALVARGWEVCHILAADAARAHRLHGAARIGSDGIVRYPAPPPDQASLFASMEAATTPQRSASRRHGG